MAGPTKVNLKIYQGSTFKELFRWESSTKAYAPITGITKAAPMVITSTAHSIPAGWRVKITNVVGMADINSSDTYQVASSVTTNTLTFSAVNSLGYKDYTSGGVLEYNTPTSLVGATARMQIRPTLDSDTIIDTLTTENGKIIVNDSTKTISILVDATTTSAYTFSSAVYSMELIIGSEVTPFIYGNVSLTKEITR